MPNVSNIFLVNRSEVKNLCYWKHKNAFSLICLFALQKKNRKSSIKAIFTIFIGKKICNSIKINSSKMATSSEITRIFIAKNYKYIH